MPIEICGCYHDGQIWTPCDEHNESIVKKGVLSDPNWWAGGTSDAGDWTDTLKSNMPVSGQTTPGQLRRKKGATNPIIEHGIDKNDFWFLPEDALHSVLHAPQHNHGKIDYSFTEDEQNYLENVRSGLLTGDIPSSKAGELTGLMIAQAQSRVIPDWSIGLHMVVHHDMPAIGLNFDGHSHSSDVPPDRLDEHLELAHNDTNPSLDNELKHRIFHQSFGHFVHNKLNGLMIPDHSHYGVI